MTVNNECLDGYQVSIIEDILYIFFNSKIDHFIDCRSANEAHSGRTP